MTPAVDLRKYVDYIIEVSKQPLEKPLNIKKITKSLNVKTNYFDSKKLDEEEKNIRGMLDYCNKTIHIRKEEYEPRMRFTFAHEIAHYILPHHVKHFSSCFKKCTEDDLKLSTDNSFEIEANHFAAELLFKGSYINKLYELQSIVDFEMIERVSLASDVSFEATSRHLIGNSPTQQILFIYNKEHPEKQPSVVCSTMISNELGMSVFKPFFAEKMSAIEKDNFSMEAFIFDDMKIGVDINCTQNDFKRSYIMTVKKIRTIIE
ncbi:MAG: ImmA/IrrE family metallo-endopeptidase [Candidatus Marinimicrobia bacterium]|nr:ImmA/IrrE family metallo-endopeptidase [Candidatus Neomarinimicrobiota bacterium]